MAETPPPFNPGQPAAAKKSANPIIWILVAVGAACCLCLIAVPFATRSGMNELGEIARCPLTMELYNESVKKYVEENGTFPPVESWEAELLPYYEEYYNEMAGDIDGGGPVAQWFVGGFKPLKPGDELVCYEGPNSKTGIYYNSAIAGKTPEELENSDNAITFFEDDGVSTNAAGDFEDRTRDSEQKVFGETRQYYEVEYGSGVKNFDFDSSGSEVQVEFN